MSTKDKLTIGGLIIFSIVVLALMTSIDDASTEAQQTKIVYKDRIVEKPGKVVTRAYLPDVCQDQIDVAQDTINEVAKVYNTAGVGTDLISDAKVAIISEDVDALNIVDQKLSDLDQSTDGAASKLSDLLLAADRARDACSQALRSK